MLNNMNKIEKLIAELCPDGVEFKKLGEVLDYEQPTKYIVQTTDYSDNYDIPVLTAGQTFILGYTNEKDGIFKATKNDPVIIFDDFTTSFHWVDFDFKVKSSAMKLLRAKKDINASLRFIYYAMLCINYIPQDHARQWIAKYSTFPIPLPPLPIQEEIVKILDTFTELEAELELKLQAELEARRKQYEYYRNTLLTPVEKDGRWFLNGKEVEWKKLGEIGTLIRGSGLQKKDFTENGVGCIHYGQIYTYYGTFADRTISFVSEETAKNLKKVSKGDLVITSTSENIEDVCKSVAWVGDNEIVTGGHAIILKHHENAKFLSYYFQTRNFFIQKIKYAKGTKVIDISVGDLAKIPIPIPPLSEQERIVAILDKFDALVNDISQGLPAELEARRKQYEYYRNRLLTFEPKQ
jgi:type I restriction enzyme S subunit